MSPVQVAVKTLFYVESEQRTCLVSIINISSGTANHNDIFAAIFTGVSGLE